MANQRTRAKANLHGWGKARQEHERSVELVRAEKNVST